MYLPNPFTDELRSVPIPPPRIEGGGRSYAKGAGTIITLSRVKRRSAEKLAQATKPIALTGRDHMVRDRRRTSMGLEAGRAFLDNPIVAVRVKVWG